MLHLHRERRRFTPAEYFWLEEQSDVRSEFYNGEIFAMGGASLAHNRLTSRLTQELGNQLRGGPCEVFSHDLRVHVERSGLYTYPDVLAICGAPQMLVGRNDTVVDAHLIVEVLSPSTESYDRGEKFRLYQALPSLHDYLLVSQDSLLVEHRARGASGEWGRQIYNSPESRVMLPRVGAQLHLGDLYAGVLS